MATISNRKPKHVETREYVERLIASGQYRDGDRLPSEAQLVERFQASRPTVARALRDLQMLGLIERRAGSGTFVSAQKARRPATAVDRQLFGLLIPELGQTEIFEPICGQIAREAQDQGHALVWGDFGGATGAGHARTLSNGERPNEERIARAERACRTFIQQHVAGVFFAPVEHTVVGQGVNASILRDLDAAQIPVVLLDRDVVAFPERSQYDLIAIDNVHGGFMLTRHLTAQGRQRICFMLRPHSAPTAERRVAGYREALAQSGLSVSPADVCYGDPLDLPFVRNVLERRKPDAIVCANDITAAALMQSLFQLGRRVPQDIAVVGFDDVKYARLLAVPLTTVRQPCADLGRVAVRAMCERIADRTLPPRAIVLEPELIVRQSCGAKR
ncbi:MAG: GntR family transcriptional regulator [Planctomycetes bacterium]|nr:GntR family transcriptional regulator [Planctomycetota bacterium]